MPRKHHTVTADLRSRANDKAGVIEWLLDEHGIRVRIKRISVGAGWTVFYGERQSRFRLGKLSRLAEDLALEIGSRAVEVGRDGKLITIRAANERVRTIRFLDHVGDNLVREIGTPFLGLADDDSAVSIKMTSPRVVHTLVVGATGSGKTSLTRTMITGMAMQASVQDVGFVLIDVQGDGFAPFRGLPHLARPVITDPDAAAKAMRWLVGLLDKRPGNVPYLFVFIDELADLAMIQDIEETLTRLAQRGRHARIHLVPATQKPVTDIVGTLVKGNIPVRIVGNVATPEDAKVATGIKQSGAEQLHGDGDMIVVDRSGRITHFQAALVEEDEIREIVVSLRGGQPVPDEPASPNFGQDNVIEFKPPEPGRPKEPPTEEQVQAALGYREQHGEWPSKLWLREAFGIGNPKAGRILDAAAERIGEKNGERNTATARAD